MTQQEKWPKILDRVIIVIGCLMALYHLVSTQYLFCGFLEHQNIHLGFALTLVYLTALKKLRRRKLWPVVVALLIASLVVVTYVKVRYDHLEMVVGLPTAIDMVIGVLLVIVVIEATRQAWGAILPIIALLFIAYFFFGKYMPWGLAHSGFPLPYIISALGIGFTGTFGFFLGVSANYIFLFMVFGAVLQASGAFGLIAELGKLAAKVLAGGPAQTAVVASSLFGTVSGSAVANVAVDGPFTIGMMKKVGYHRDMAGAIEATASTGGQLMPPVMGAAAFVMAGFLGVPYAVVMVAAIIPSILYYYSVGLAVEVVARKEKIVAPKETVDFRVLVGRAPGFVVPLGIITVLLLMRYSPMYAAFWAIIAVVVISFIRKDTRPSWYGLVRGFADGAKAGASIAVICSLVGIIAQTLYSTALGIKFTAVVEGLSGGNLIIALFLTMIVSLILGCGVPTTAAYILVALVVCPALVRMGMEILSAHFFAFYFAIISALTPPVAVAVLTAVGISGGNYWKTGLNAVRLAASAFIIPYCWAYNPVFLAQHEALLPSILSITAAFVAMSAFIGVVYNHFLAPITRLELALYALCTIIALSYVFNPSNYLLFAVGALLFIGLMVMQWKTRRRLATAKAMQMPT